MPKFCIGCGVPLKDDAKFCTGCGQSIGAGRAPVTADGAEEHYDAEEDAPVPRKKRLLIGGAVAALLALAGGGYYLYGKLGAPGTGPVSVNNAMDATATVTGVQTDKYIVADANVRNRATANGTAVVTKLLRGTKVSGAMQLGEDGTSRWFKLTNGGFISAVNLSDVEPPMLARLLGDADWYSPGEIQIRALPDDNGAVIETVQPGTHLVVAGITQNNFAEMKLNKGGVGYIPGYLVNVSTYPNAAYPNAAAAATDAAEGAAAAASGAANAAADAATKM